MACDASRLDLVQLAQVPLARQAGGLRLEVGRSVAAQEPRLVPFGIGHPGFEALVDEEAPDLLVGDVADEILDVDAAIAERPALAVGLGDLGLDGDDAFEARLEVAHRPPD